MKRACFRIRLKPGVEEEYAARHERVWPELLEVIRESGVSNYSLFRNGLDVIAYAECEPDGPTVFQRIAADSLDAKWSSWMADVIESEVDGEGNLFYFEEVWHMSE